MNERRIASQEVEALIKKYNQGTASPTERAKLEQWYHREITERSLKEEQGDFLLLKDVLWDSVADRAGLIDAKESPRKVYYWNRFLRIAAVAAMVLMATAAIWMGVKRYSGKTADVQTATIEADITPGGNRATLTLADGRQVNLNESHNGIVIGSDAITYADGSAVVNAESIEYASLSTPRGGMYQVTLPDGSKVWLNAASTLKYPIHFPAGKSRVVELEGEAYFEVASLSKSGITSTQPSGNTFTHASEKIPFLVKTKQQTVEVLGTQFNISAYAEEADTKTTLVEGRVRVSVGEQQGKATILRPGQQAVVHQSVIDVQQVNTEPFVAWKSGVFIFDDTPLDIVMRQMMRWYDIDVDLAQLPNRQITGIVSRQESLSTFLEALAISSDLHFTLEERRLILKRK